MLLSNHFQKSLFHLIAVMSFTLFYGGHTISWAVEATIEETLSDDVVFFEVANVKAGDTLSIYKSPSDKSEQLGNISADESCVAYLNEFKEVDSQKWVKITSKNVQGWVNLQYLKRNWESPCGTYYQLVNIPRNDVLNLRQSPTTSSQKMGRIPYDYGGCLTGIDEAFAKNKRKWVLLDYEGTKGWASAYYLRTVSVDDCDI